MFLLRVSYYEWRENGYPSQLIFSKPLARIFSFLNIIIFLLNTGLGCKIERTTEVSFLYNWGPSPTHIRNITDKMKSYLLCFELKECCTEGNTQTSGIFSTDKSLNVFVAYKNPWKSVLGSGTSVFLVYFLWEPE